MRWVFFEELKILPTIKPVVSLTKGILSFINISVKKKVKGQIIKKMCGIQY